MATMRPTYRHTCSKCRFLGATWKQTNDADDEGPVVDWYVCEGSDPSVVGRFSSDGPDYWSSPKSMVTAKWCAVEGSNSSGFRAIDPMRVVALYMLHAHLTPAT